MCPTSSCWILRSAPWRPGCKITLGQICWRVAPSSGLGWGSDRGLRDGVEGALEGPIYFRAIGGTRSCRGFRSCVGIIDNGSSLCVRDLNDGQPHVTLQRNKWKLQYPSVIKEILPYWTHKATDLSPQELIFSGYKLSLEVQLFLKVRKWFFVIFLINARCTQPIFWRASY